MLDCRADLPSTIVMLSLLGCRCAHRAPPRVGPLPPRPEAHSSIDAALRHKQKLGLSVEQVRLLEELDGRLAAENFKIRDEMMRPPAGYETSGPHDNAKAAGRGDGPPGGAMGGWRGGGPGGGLGPSGGMGAGGLMGGGFGRGPSGPTGGGHPAGGLDGGDAPDRDERFKKAMQRTDENNTAAYLEAESVFTEEQRDKAREYTSQYREQLWAWRQAMAEMGQPATAGGGPAVPR